MTDDEQIRALVHTWLAATRSGDIDTILGLMTEDAVFLVPGRPPMDKAGFAALSRMPPGTPRPALEITPDIEELVVAGDVAYLRMHLAVRVTPPGGAAPVQRAGYTLTVFRRVAGRWLLARDANLLAPVPTPAS